VWTWLNKIIHLPQHNGDKRTNAVNHISMRLQRNLQRRLPQWTNNECSHILMRVTRKVSDHHLHHEQQWQAATTTHWYHHLPTVGADKNMIINWNSRKIIKQTSVSWLSLTFPGVTGRHSHVGSTQEKYMIKKVNSILIEGATNLWGQLHFILTHPCRSKHLTLRNQEAYIEGSGWASCPLNRSLYQSALLTTSTKEMLHLMLNTCPFPVK
jgi:hypothetical protein